MDYQLVIPSLKPISYQSLEAKQTIKIDDEEIIDLCSESFSKTVPMDYTLQISTISEDLSGRPHLVSRILMGSEDDADILMHYNHVSNPYSMDGTFTFITPNRQTAVEAIKKSASSSQKENESQVELNKTVAEKDKKRIMELIRQSNPQMVSESTTPIRTTNMTTEPQTEEKDGEIVFGTNVVSKRCSGDLSSTQSRTEMIRKTIRSMAIKS